MGGSVPPYLYTNREERYSDPFNNGFDPKAVTRASWAPPPPKAKQDGPLINFNRHPDSWQQAAYGSTNATPMSPNTKRKVQGVRWAQLGLRVVNWLGAAGVIVCMALLSNVKGIASWATRAAPAVDFVIALYAITHLARGAKRKVPASAASYHIFAILTDIALIPFYVYIAMADRWNLSQPVDNKSRWKSLLPSQEIADQLIAYTWIIAIAVGALHLVTASLSVYLAVMFRKIAKLPPDLNPLEDNLTSRRKSKHKYKSSEISEASQLHNKHDSGISLPWEDQKRPLSFISTRNDSTGQLYSPHNPKTANESRASLPMVAEGINDHPSSAVSAPSIMDPRSNSPVSAPSIYSQPSFEHLSRVNVHNVPRPPPRASSPLKQTELSRLNSVAASSVYSDRSEDSKSSAPNLPRKSSKRTSGTFASSENWSTFRDENDENSDPAFSIVPEEDEDMSEIDLHPQPQRPYQPVRNSSFVEDLDDELSNDNRYAPTPPPKSPGPAMQQRAWDPTIVLQPLSMNPPTPPPLAAGQSPRPQSQGNVIAPLSTTSIASSSPSNSRPSSPGKGRYYGDLKSAVQGVRSSPTSSPHSKRPLSSPHREPGLNTNEWLTPPRHRETLKEMERHEQPQYERLNNRMDEHGRVASRSGADLSGRGGYQEDVPGEFQDFMGMNARNVSGKVIEEGFGGRWARRRISGR